VAALFMYGQTGSGKTHTMSSIEEMGAQQLFHTLNDHPRAQVKEI
jgi:chromosomal replication initiation ATPase DnaA